MRPRVLVADEPRDATGCRTALEAVGFQVTTVTDGEAALEAGLSGEHDVLLVAVELPWHDGLVVVRRLRSAGVTVPIVLTGTVDDADAIAAGLDAGADDYVVKPLRFDELRARLRLRLRRARGVAWGSASAAGCGSG